MILCIKHISIEGPGLIGEYFNKRGYQMSTVDLSRGEKLPGDFSDIEAVIILGGPMNVYEEEEFPFLKEEDIFIKNLIRLRKPVLGICLGAQLIAKASGAVISKADYKEVGFYKINLTCSGKRNKLFKKMPANFDVFQWHEDTFEIPENGELLAKGHKVEAQAISINDRSFGLQFHLEVDEVMIVDWIQEYLDSNENKMKEKGKKMLGACYKLKDSLAANAEQLCCNFENIIKEAQHEGNRAKYE